MENKQKIKTIIDVLNDMALEYYPNESQKEERNTFFKNSINVVINAFEAGIVWAWREEVSPLSMYHEKADVLNALKSMANDYLEKNNNI